MAKIKRKPRNIMAKKKELDLTKPLPLDIIGSVDDPCFGKHNDPTAPECQRCGDCEICSIVQAQNMHVKRKEIESQNKFKDLKKLGKKKKKKK